MKFCSRCQTNKPFDEFVKSKGTKDGLYTYCKKCACQRAAAYRRKYPEKVKASNLKSIAKNGKPKYTKEQRKKHALKSRFGLTVEDFNNMLKEQMDVCAICLKPEIVKNRDGSIKSLSVDHCHETGIVRGLLCDSCNYALGCFKDNIFLINSASQYLEAFHEKENKHVTTT